MRNAEVLTVWLPEGLKSRLRDLAWSRRKTMTQVVVELLEQATTTTKRGDKNDVIQS